MKKTTMRASAALLAAAGMAGNAWGGCVSDPDMASLKTAALQQELMVAAFSCHAVDSYNRFVRSHQPELIASDARLKAYFVQRDGAKRGEAAYHTYKTELANTSSLSSLHDDGFCDRAGADFDATRDGIHTALDMHRWAIEATYHACHPQDRPILADASAEMPPWRTQLAARDDRDPSASGRSGRNGSRFGSGRMENEAAELKTPRPHRPLDDAR